MPRKAKARNRQVAPPPPQRIWLPSADPTREEQNGETDLKDSHIPPHQFDAQALPDAIASAVHGFFDLLTTSSGAGGGGVTAARPGKAQWTVVAGFVALEGIEGGGEDGDGGAGRKASQKRLITPTRLDRIPGVRAAAQDGRFPETQDASWSYTNTSGRWVTLKICSIASGVKCLGGTFESGIPPSNAAQGTPSLPRSTPSPVTHPALSSSGRATAWSERDSQVLDMHAEVLARRELECLLVREMRTLIRRDRRRGRVLSVNAEGEADQGVLERNHEERENEEDEIEPILLEMVHPSCAILDLANHASPSSPRQRPRPVFRLKPSIQLVLYTSHAPCGAASDAAHLRRLDAEDSSIRDLLSRLHPLASDPPPDHQISAFRRSKSLDVAPICKKPSRADAPPTSAFSCSDKLGRWQWLGFQGGRLARFFDSEARCGEVDTGPIRIDGLVVGEDYESASLHKIFSTVASGVEGTAYSRLGEGLQEVLTGRGESSGKRWLKALTEDEPCRIWHTTQEFAYGRAAITLSNNPAPSIPPDLDINTLRALPLPLLRDILLPPPPSAPTPFPVALSYHAYSIPEAIGPNGRLSGVTRDKRTKMWSENSVARVARGRMWDAYEDLVGDYTEAFGESCSRFERTKGGKGWIEASSWMEERGPYAGWHSRS